MKEFKYTINGNKYEVAVGDKSGSNVEVTVNGEKYNVELEQKKAAVAQPAAAKPVAPKAAPSTGSGQVVPKPAAAPAASAGEVNLQDALKAPLPGTVIDILVSVGDEVKAGQTLLVLEAMKMKNELEAEHDGKVTEVLVSAGQAVMADDALVAY